MQFLDHKKARAGLLILVLGAAIVIALSPFVVGLLGALVLYVLCVPVYHRLRARLSADAAAAVTLVLALIVIAAPVTWIIVLVADQAPSMLRAAQDSDLFSSFATLPKFGRIDVGAELAKAGGTLIRWLSQHALSFVGGAAQSTLNLVISFFALYYMLVGADHLWETFREILPFSRESADELRERFYKVTYATMLGTSLTALAQGSLIGLGFVIIGIPNPLFWGVVTGFASILPVLGSALVWLPATIVLVAQQRYGAAVGLFIIGAVLASNIDNIIRPLIYRRVSNIHPMVTLLGAFAGARYFGLLGVLLGPLAIQYFFEFLKLYRREYGVFATDGYPTTSPGDGRTPVTTGSA